MFLNASICGIIALVITVLMTIGTFVTTYRTISKKAVKKNRKKFFSVVIQTIGFFTAFLTCQSLTIPIIFKLPVIFGMHIVRTMTYGSITCQCILEAFFVILNFLPKDLSKKIVVNFKPTSDQHLEITEGEACSVHYWNNRDWCCGFDSAFLHN